MKDAWREGRGCGRGAALRQMAGEVSQLLHRGCQFKFRTTNATHRGRTSKGMPTKFTKYCTPGTRTQNQQHSLGVKYIGYN